MTEHRNVTRIRIDAGNNDESVAADKAVADSYSTQFHTPLTFELLESHMPFYQSALRDRLEYELMFEEFLRINTPCGLTFGRPMMTGFIAMAAA